LAGHSGHYRDLVHADKSSAAQPVLRRLWPQLATRVWGSRFG